jgi:putative transposase
MGLSGISKSQVSKLCKDIDERVNAFLDRSIERRFSAAGSCRRGS